jgi:hypothetical protein
MVKIKLFRKRLHIKKIVHGCVIQFTILYQSKKWGKLNTIDVKIGLESYHSQVQPNFIDN